MRFKAISLPGHTKCSMGFFLEENSLLLSSETLGVYLGRGLIFPLCLSSYDDALASFDKVSSLDIQSILPPHFRLLDPEETQSFLSEGKRVLLECEEKITSILKNGGNDEDAFEYFKKTYYKDEVKPYYPPDAFRLNTEIIIRLIKKREAL